MSWSRGFRKEKMKRKVKEFEQRFQKRTDEKKGGGFGEEVSERNR